MGQGEGMRIHYRKKFATYDEANKYLEERGELEYFGVIATNQPGNVPFHVIKIHLHDGRSFKLYVYEDGLVEVTD
jgi:hypothetical protein